MQKLLLLEQVLHNRVIGQEEAVTAVSEAVIRARAGLKGSESSGRSFIFLGPTGVGKTELARALAEYLFDDEHNMVGSTCLSIRRNMPWPVWSARLRGTSV